MTIGSEWDLLELIRRRIDERGCAAPPDLIVGIGDDCAVVAHEKNHGLFTADICIEDVHFRRDCSPLADIGWKAMVSNLSDIAAMGGRARLALVSLGIPPSVDAGAILDIYDGMIDAATAAGARIAGGDLSRAAQLVISIALWGEAAPGRVVRRSGARPGDHIYVTGDLGASRGGLEALLAGAAAPGALIDRHRRPPLRIPAVPRLLEEFAPTAMIDVSDGLLGDLGHLARCSGTGFELRSADLPLAAVLSAWCAEGGRNPADYGLSSGEEYELLFTSARPPQAAPLSIDGTPVTAIGRITEQDFLVIDGTTARRVTPTGYDHFG